MGEDEVNSGGREWKHTIHTCVTIVLMVTLVFITCQGYKLTEMRNMKIKCSGRSYSYIALLFGVFTVIFGFISFVIGLTVVAARALGLSGWIQKDYTETSKEKESRANRRMFIHTIIVIGSMLMMAWAIYHGYNKGAEEDHGVALDNCLTCLIGVVSIAFGIIYFIIGMGLLAESLHSSSSLHQAVNRDDPLLDRWTDAKSTNDFCDP